MWIKQYPDLLFSEPSPGVLLITINKPKSYNATDADLHRQLETVWTQIQGDPYVRVAAITGAGKAFSAGGDIEMIRSAAGDYGAVSALIEGREGPRQRHGSVREADHLSYQRACARSGIDCRAHGGHFYYRRERNADGRSRETRCCRMRCAKLRLSLVNSQEPRLELLAVRPIVDPFARRRDPLSSSTVAAWPTTVTTSR
jgi:hypothetical protein